MRGVNLKETEVNVNWNINAGTILTVLAMGTASLMYIASIDARVKQGEDYRVIRSNMTDKNFANVNAQLDAMKDLPYRIGQLEAQANAANARMDRIADSFLGSAESIKKDVNALTTKVEVMSQKIDNLDVPRTRKTSFTPPS